MCTVFWFELASRLCRAFHNVSVQLAPTAPVFGLVIVVDNGAPRDARPPMVVELLGQPSEVRP